MYKLIIIGIDQSYTRSGISIAADGKLLRISSEAFKGCKSKTDKRNRLIFILNKLIHQAASRSARVAIICERIRLKSQRFVSVNYIVSTGALVGSIVDVAAAHNVKVYSVDTRSWKSQIVGTSKGKKNKYGVDEHKWPTIEYIRSLGFASSICSRNRNGELVFNDDAADSGCIALYGFLPKSRRKLKLEE
jgi:Holliday junction resolvasome RuvABC endonuclease subunit